MMDVAPCGGIEDYCLNVCEVTRFSAMVGECCRRVRFPCASEGTKLITERLLDVGVLGKGKGRIEDLVGRTGISC